MFGPDAGQDNNLEFDALPDSDSIFAADTATLDAITSTTVVGELPVSPAEDVVVVEPTIVEPEVTEFAVFDDLPLPVVSPTILTDDTGADTADFVVLDEAIDDQYSIDAAILTDLN